MPFFAARSSVFEGRSAPAKSASVKVVLTYSSVASSSCMSDRMSMAWERLEPVCCSPGPLEAWLKFVERVVRFWMICWMKGITCPPEIALFRPALFSRLPSPESWTVRGE